MQKNAIFAIQEHDCEKGTYNNLLFSTQWWSWCTEVAKNNEVFARIWS